jgi:hypothetical protein
MVGVGSFFFVTLRTDKLLWPVTVGLARFRAGSTDFEFELLLDLCVYEKDLLVSPALFISLSPSSERSIREDSDFSFYTLMISVISICRWFTIPS